MDKWTEKCFQRKKWKYLKTHEKTLNIPGHKEMQIKTTLRFHLIPVRTETTKNTNNNKY
jgi:hypothetical protein